MNLLDELRTLGVDVDDGLKRLMGNEKLYKRLLAVSYTHLTLPTTSRV